jgi:hypothetical protein
MITSMSTTHQRRRVLQSTGFLRLMNALKPRPPFQILIMSEESRLEREEIETSWRHRRLLELRSHSAAYRGRFNRRRRFGLGKQPTADPMHTLRSHP